MGCNFAPRGYAYVAQDVRGSGESEGIHSWRNEGWLTTRDGQDTMVWAAAQDWCDGNLGAMGGSGSGMTSDLMAPTRPPGLRATAVHGSEEYRALHYRGGALHNWITRAVPFWIPANGHRPADGAREPAQRTAAELESWLRHLPLRDYPPAQGLADWYFDVIDHPEEGAYWWTTDTALKSAEVEAPALYSTGWFDFSKEHADRRLVMGRVTAPSGWRHAANLPSTSYSTTRCDHPACCFP